MSDGEWISADEATCDAAHKTALAEAMKAFASLGEEPESKDVMVATLRAFSAITKVMRSASDAFEAAHPDQKCYSIYADVRHIVLSAFYATAFPSAFPDLEDIHPYSIGGGRWEGVIAACIALDAASHYETSSDVDNLEQWGCDHADAVLAKNANSSN